MARSLVEVLGLSAPAGLVGLSAEEIEEVAVDQAVDSLPGRYVEFLRVMGRSAGPLLVGTDAFYPDILGLKRDARELLVENGVSELAPPDAIFFAMHQGYQVYWMPNSSPDDPPVSMYQEGDKGVTRHWESFTDFLRHERSKVAQ